MNILKTTQSIAIAAAAALTSATLPAATYYKVGSDTIGISSFEGNVSEYVGWATTLGATETEVIPDFANSDFVVPSGYLLRTPSTGSAWTFGGRSLRIEGSGDGSSNSFLIKSAANSVITVPNLIADGGCVSHGSSDYTITYSYTLAGNITIVNGSSVWFQAADSCARELIVDSAIHGDATTVLGMTDRGGNGAAIFRFNDLSDFSGTITDVATASGESTAIYINGAFGGSVNSLSSKTTLTVDYDGLPVGMGLRVTTTAVPAALKTSLTFTTKHTAIAADGARLLTFPAGTQLDAGEFTISCSLSGMPAPVVIPVRSVTNGDGTVSIVTQGSGSPFYKIGSDAVFTSSFSTNVSATVGWALDPAATTTEPFSASRMLFSDFVVPAGRMLRTPETGSTWTFGGRSLRIEGVGDGSFSTVLLKAPSDTVITFNNIVSAGGCISHGYSDAAYTYSYTLSGNITIENGSSIWFHAADSNTREINVDAPIHGDATTVIGMTDRNGTGSAIFCFNNLSDFSGVMTDVDTAAEGSTMIYINGPFGGTIGALSAKSTLAVNYGGLPEGTGLRVSAATIPDTIKTRLTFYSPSINFEQHLLPLVSFPSGTVVDPSEFTIKHAASRTGAATAIPHLTTYTGTDGSVVLAVDAMQPVTARMVNDNGTWSWHFYGNEGDDVTATCGLIAPNASITVVVTSTDEIAHILANPGTPAGYKIESLTVNADADLTPLSPLSVNNSSIDLAGHSLTVPGTFFNGVTTSSRNVIANGTFEADTVSDGGVLSATPNGWNSSGSVLIIRKNSEYTYTLRNTASNYCYIPKNAYITQTFTLTEDAVLSISLSVCNKNVYNSSTGKISYWSSDGNIEIDGTQVISWIGSDGRSQERTITSSTSLSAGTHTVKISCTSNTGNAIDNVNLSFTPSAATITSTATGGELHVTVPEGETASNAAVNLAGHLKFVKEGAGTFVSNRRGLTYDGGNEVVNGRLTTTAGDGLNRDWSPFYKPLGERGNTITVRKDGILDIAGNYEYGHYPIVLDGGNLRSSTLAGSFVTQTANQSFDGIGRLTLTTNSTFYLRSDTLFSGWNEHGGIDLGGHELLFDCPIANKIIYMAKDMTNGTIRIAPANSGTRCFAICKRDVDARTVDVIDYVGISPEMQFSVRNYTAAATVASEWCTGTANMNVFGVFTPQTDYFYGVTMQNGSTIDISAKSGSWSLQSASTYGKRIVDFADGATIYVKAKHPFSRRVPVISWDNSTRPANLDTLTFKSGDIGRGDKFLKRDDGLYPPIGLVILIR